MKVCKDTKRNILEKIRKEKKHIKCNASLQRKSISRRRNWSSRRCWVWHGRSAKFQGTIVWASGKGKEIMYLETGCLPNSKVKNRIWETPREWKEANGIACVGKLSWKGSRDMFRSWERCEVKVSFNTVDVSACFMVDSKVPREGNEWWKYSWESRIWWNSCLRGSGLLRMRAGTLLSYQ